ncbi:hypothetical protein [Lacrimispora indolis]|uniref:hypothetical protein n=1 Tax=Lacrimispora indolis TaxID=69825 RepID=UPI00041B852A|nr:hypothetical protein [[Clostridium] methoxybenzovorans]
MEKLLFLPNHWLFRAFFSTVVPLLISAINDLSDWKNEKGEWNNIFSNGKIFVLVLSLIYIAYIIYMAYCERKKENLENLIEKLELKNKDQQNNINTYNKILESLCNIINISQKQINDMSKEIISKENLDLLTWNFNSVSTYICNDIVDILKKISKNGTDITANIYIKKKIKKGRRTQEYVKMISHSGGTNSAPKILNTEMLLSSKKDWQFAKLFLNNNPKIIIFENEEEIKNNFKFNGNISNYSGEYTQYIGIPISCSGGNILSSLEIICHHETILAETKDEILDIVNKYIIVYRNFALLSHKIEKGLRAKRVPLEDDVKEVEYGEETKKTKKN